MERIGGKASLTTIADGVRVYRGNERNNLREPSAECGSVCLGKFKKQCKVSSDKGCDAWPEILDDQI